MRTTIFLTSRDKIRYDLMTCYNLLIYYYLLLLCKSQKDYELRNSVLTTQPNVFNRLSELSEY